MVLYLGMYTRPGAVFLSERIVVEMSWKENKFKLLLSLLPMLLPGIKSLGKCFYYLQLLQSCLLQSSSRHSQVVSCRDCVLQLHGQSSDSLRED